jgi:hypothetical protein
MSFADSIGDTLTFKILKNDQSTVLHRCVVRSAADAKHQNKRVKFKPDVQEIIDRTDLTPVSTHRNIL